MKREGNPPTSRVPPIVAWTVIAAVLCFYLTVLPKSFQRYGRNQNTTGKAYALMQAIEAHRKEVGDWPSGATNPSLLESDAAFMAWLNSPRTFYGGPARDLSSEGALIDAWGKPYRVGFSRIVAQRNPDGTAEMVDEFLVYSAGPDGDFSTWEDNYQSGGRSRVWPHDLTAPE